MQSAWLPWVSAVGHCLFEMDNPDAARHGYRLSRKTLISTTEKDTSPVRKSKLYRTPLIRLSLPSAEG
jgi:hypothetical protein